MIVDTNVSLKSFTTLGIGGPARYLVRAGSETLVDEAVRFARQNNLPILVLGGGSNLVVADEGYPGVVLRIEISGLRWIDEGSQVRVVAGAGEDWDRFVAECVERRLFGVECLSGIPGLVGGTPVQNVGAYGQEVADTLTRVRVYDRTSGSIDELTREQCRFGYRSSVFNTFEIGRFIVLSVEYLLRKEERPSIRYPDLAKELENTKNPTLTDIREAVLRIRGRKAMILRPGDPDCRSVGSFFKNPVVNPETFADIEARAVRANLLSPGEKVPRYPAADGKVKTAAAWLIERSGVSRGFDMGRAGVSRKHTLALINKGGATAVDVIALAREIRKRVEDRFGVRLMVEPVFVGFDEAIRAEFSESPPS